MQAQIRQQKSLTLIPSTVMPDYILFLIGAANMEQKGGGHRLRQAGAEERMFFSPLRGTVLTFRNPWNPIPPHSCEKHIFFLIRAATMETESNRRRTLTMIMETSGSLGQNVLLTTESSGIDLKKPQDPYPSTFM